MSEMPNSTVSRPKPPLLLISLSNLQRIEDEYSTLFSTISGFTHFLTARSENEALELLSKDGLRYVLIGDVDIVLYKHKLLRDCLVEFTKNGGIVVHACEFVTPEFQHDQARYYKHGWGLPWKPASYLAENSFLNPYAQHRIEVIDLPVSFEWEGIFLRNVGVGDAVYVSPRQGYNGLMPEVPVALTKIGSGFMGYVGQEYFTAESIGIILAMFGLP